MPKNSWNDYSTTAASNTDVHSVSIAEGMAPSDVNNAMGELMVDVANFDQGNVTLTSPLAVASGGTGAATHTANNVLVGAGTGAVTSIAPSTSGNVLTSNGTVWQSTAAASGGKIGQVLQAVKTNRTSFAFSTTDAYSTLTGLTQAITPAATSSKVLVSGYVSWHLAPSANGTAHFAFFRDSTQIGSGAADASRVPSGISFRSPADAADWYTYGIISSAFEFLDSPSSTSAITYSI